MRRSPQRTVSIANTVQKALEDDIYSLVYLPGEKLTESDLASHYGVSRNTMRESFAYLITNGVLVKEVNKGVHVRRITAADIREIFHLRGLLEMEALEVLCTRDQLPEALVEALEDVEELEEKGDRIQSLQADIRFHEMLVKEAGSDRLLRLYQSILCEVRMCLVQSNYLVPIRQEKISQHRQILEAIKQKNVSAAKRLLSNHMDQAITNYECAYLSLQNLEITYPKRNEP